MRGILPLAVIGLIIGAVLLTPTDVPSLNEHAGAVAYAKPSLKVETVATTAVSGDRATLDASGLVTSIPVRLEVEPLRFVAPAPTKKALWEQLLPSGTIQLQPGPDTGSVIGGGSCTNPRTTSEEVTLKNAVVAKVLISEPGGTMTTWRSERQELVLRADKITTTCDSNPRPTVFYSIKDGASMSFDIGTYYFAKGWGAYLFDARVLRIDDASGLETEIGSLQLTVNVTEGGLGSG